MATGAEVLSIGALVPQKYRDGRNAQPTSRDSELPGRRILPGEQAGDPDDPIPLRSHKATAARELATAQFTPAERPEPFDVPTAALERFISSPAGSDAPLPPRHPETPTLHDAVRNGDLQVFGAISGKQLDEAGDMVELSTGNKAFGMVRQVSPTRIDASDQRRGAVYLQPTEQGTGNGITLEFLQAWFASTQVQAEMWALARAGRHRLSISVHDVLDIRADFPPSSECARIAAEWSEIEEIRRFAVRLNAVTRFRRQHVLDRPSG